MCQKIKLLFLSTFFLSGYPVYTQIINKIPLSERITGYSLAVRLNTDKKSITGSMDAFWVNKSSDTVPEVQLHMYMNAFRDNRTTFYRERGGSPGNKESDPGWIDIFSLTDRNGNDLMPGMQYFSPDDGNPDDRTVLKVNLPEPALPGDTVFLKAVFETKLPSRIERTGFNDDFYFVAQWFPKFGVYEPEGMRYASKGAWNCHQFHSNSEFYANHSVYDVSVTLPAGYVAGSCGMLLSEKDQGQEKTLTWRAEDIVDFAWTAWPGYTVFKDKWNNVDITLLMPKDRSGQAGRQFTAVKNALEYLNDNVGPYPWSHLTFVDPPAKGANAGGMEYTTLFTSASSFIMPSFLHMPEMVTVHEFGHAYFMGILASNEFEEPWLDEGINSFWEERIMDHYYGNNSGLLNHPLLQIADKSYSRLGYTKSSGRQVTSNASNSWNYPHGTYSMMSYLKTATWLYTLMGIIGEETTNDIFREYYRKWAFRHPSGRDFTDIVNEVVRKEHGTEFGPDMNWFFDQTLYGTGICDYKVSGISNRQHQKFEGKPHGSSVPYPGEATADSIFTATAQIERAGEVMLPVEILVHFTDGSEIREKWDGKARFRDFVYEGSRKIEWVKIDPDFKIRMDVNLVNNSLTTEPYHTPMRRLMDKFFVLLEFVLSMVYL